MKTKLIIPGKPISVNDLYTGRRFLTKDGREMKQTVGWQVKSQWKAKPKLIGDLRIYMDFFYMDKRRRDIDNPVKAMMDCLTGLVFADDSQIIEMHITKNVGIDRTEIVIEQIHEPAI